MKIYDIIHLITDVRIKIRLIELSTLFDYGCYKKENLVKSKLYNKKIKKIDIQYYNENRTIVLYV